MSKDKSIPAFPVKNTILTSSTKVGYPGYCQDPGMSLRDYFAAKAMHAYLVGNTQCPDRDIAKGAYALADAMLEERKK